MHRNHEGGGDPHRAVAPVNKKLLEALKMVILQEYLYMAYSTTPSVSQIIYRHMTERSVNSELKRKWMDANVA
jgi:hypothetical protein